MITNTTAFCRRCPASNRKYKTIAFIRLVFEFPHELTEGKIRNLFTKEGFHTAKVQVFKEQNIKLLTEIYRKFPMVVRSLIFSLFMDTRNVL